MSALRCWHGLSLRPQHAPWYLLVVLLGCLLPALAHATAPPLPGMLDRMRKEGTLAAAQARAKELGTYDMRLPNHGKQYSTLSPQEMADQIMQHHGWALDHQGKAASKLTSAQLSPLELDLNCDRTVDERDILTLGFPRPKQTAKLPSMGALKILVFYIDFPDYPLWYGTDELNYRLFTDGDENVDYRSLHWFYEHSSYGNVAIDGTLFHYTAPHERSYYHPNDNNHYDYEETRRMELLSGAAQALDATGMDFSQFDNDHDGTIDYYSVIWTGPHGDWMSYWWEMCFPNYSFDQTFDGVTFHGSTFSWNWEQQYSFYGWALNLPHYTPTMFIHETGHAFGLPDLYDYDDTVGPDGGDGGMDMMDHNWGDHNCFSKYILGWMSPTIAFTNLNDYPVGKSSTDPDSVIFMPGFDPVSPWSEYFMAQYRKAEDTDLLTPANGMLLWHIDCRVSRLGAYLYNNSYTAHKLLRLMEADGLEEIENGDHDADAGDYYQTGLVLSPASTPNSNRYDGSDSGITCNDFSAPAADMTADFTLYTSNPPQVSITAPGAGSTVSGNSVSVTVDATDDVGVTKVQLIIDGQLAQTWNSWSNPSTYTWNTNVEFNKTLSLTARAWDSGGQSGSSTISVTVSNTGVTAISDGFESGLGKWRVVNTPELKLGTYTEWALRTSPPSPPPLGSGTEAYISTPNDGQQYFCKELLRSQRFNATGFTHPVRVQFYYRCWSDGQLLISTDNGNSWSRLAVVPSASPWTAFDQSYSALQGQTFYLGYYYDGTAESDYDTLCDFNIDNVSIQELPSDPPVIQITSPQDGGVVSGPVLISTNATDDGSIVQVKFYLNNVLAYTDDAAPWQYFWNNTNDDNHPALPIKAIAVDNDGLFSLPSEIHIALRLNWTYPVYEDLENNVNWSVNNHSPTPDWTWVSNKGHTGLHSYGWVLGGGADGANYDAVQYNGHANLAAATVSNPVIRICYTGDMPTDGRVDVYFVNSWTGNTLLFSLDSDQADWIDYSYSLNGFIGYSGKIYLYMSNYNTSGTGVWIDDLRVENDAPYISSISPARGVPGTTVIINGMSFGFSRQAGSYVTFGGGVVPADSDYVSWNNNQIQVHIPSTAISGNVSVTVNSQASNGTRVAVLLPAPDLEDLQQQ